MIKVFNVLKVFKGLNDFTTRKLGHFKSHYKALKDFEDFEPLMTLKTLIMTY